MAEQNGNPVVIIKRKSAHDAHHGGAWKVAYADFVTAMMALFIVLWLTTASDQVKKAIGGYFQDPKGYGKMVGSSLAGNGESLSISKNELSKVREKLEAAMKQAPAFKTLEKNIQVTVTGEGLRVELLESAQGMFLETGSPGPSKFGSDILKRIAAELGKMPNRILIEGHTDSVPMAGNSEYTNWELSADRANMARRIMQASGLWSGQVTQIRGFADQRLRNVKDPKDPANRRISLIVAYLPEEKERIDSQATRRSN
jgi:chemotaxis protein MotB